MPQIRFEKLSKYYLESCALKEATGVINQGDKFLVLGENGSGKSTFLKLISGQISPSGGKITIDDRPFVNESRRRFAILGESKFIYLDLTIKENLGLSTALEKNEVENLCSEFGLDYLSSRTVRQLSSGQKQKVSAVKAISSKSDFLVLDEPLNFLDTDSKIKLVNILEASNKTVVLVSHESDYFSQFKKMEIKRGVLFC